MKNLQSFAHLQAKDVQMSEDEQLQRALMESMKDQNEYGMQLGGGKETDSEIHRRKQAK